MLRLNGVVSGSTSSDAAAVTGAPWRRKPTVPPLTGTFNQTATPAQRKQQLAQLAEMGVAIPEDFRKEMAMAGEWQTLSETPIHEAGNIKGELEDRKPQTLNVGVRKRKYEGQEEDEEAGEMLARRGWGSTTRVYPGLNDRGEDDLDLLLGKAQVNTRRSGTEATKISGENRFHDHSVSEEQVTDGSAHSALERPVVKNEDSGEAGNPLPLVPSHGSPDDTTIKIETRPLEPEITFKKRRPKSMRQK